jgi:hypothetical protein
MMTFYHDALRKSPQGVAAEAMRRIDGVADIENVPPRRPLSGAIERRGAAEDDAQHDDAPSRNHAAARTFAPTDAHKLRAPALRELRECAKPAAMTGIVPAFPATLFAYFGGSSIVERAARGNGTETSLARSTPPRRAMNRALHMHAHFRSS